MLNAILAHADNAPLWLALMLCWLIAFYYLSKWGGNNGQK